MNDGELGARVLSALARERYAGLHLLDLPREPDGFVSGTRFTPPVPLEQVLALVRAAADPGDDVAAFERECRETLALHAMELPEVRPGPTRHDALAARLGHPVHPLGRCKLGLSPAELRAYAPEFQPSFELCWTGVADPVTAGVLPGWWPSPGELGLRGAAVFPVHPLTVARGLVTGPVARHLGVAPTLSMRTLAVTATEHVKVPMPTSTLGARNVRAIKPGTLQDGAKVQRILARAAAETGAPVLLADEQTYGHARDPYLGYLVRRMPAAGSVPVAALLAPGVLDELCDDVEAFFSGYLRVLFGWNAALFERYGIALEAHQQNVAVTRRGELVVKDNDGALFDEIRHAGEEFDDPRLKGDREALARVFVTITLHLCAGALAFGLAERGLLPLRTGLALVRDRLDEAVTDPFLRARTLDADRLPAKAMLTAGTLVPKRRTGAADINKHYGPDGPNYLREPTCC
ncbi:IucA/IucC family protein [Actinocorallia longicatena]|uniref:IucA/IucC family protein n=1 Tax=Actinocorallia longicatena TaxID=111803 RepID=A0ABP6Q0J7_9ACTN